MCYVLRWVLDEEATANQISVSIRPHENNITITKNISLGDNALRIYLIQLIISGLHVILKV